MTTPTRAAICTCGGDMAHDYHQDWCPAVPSANLAPLEPCTQAELDAFEGLDPKSKILFSMWVDRALKAEAALAVTSTERL